MKDPRQIFQNSQSGHDLYLRKRVLETMDVKEKICGPKFIKMPSNISFLHHIYINIPWVLFQFTTFQGQEKFYELSFLGKISTKRVLSLFSISYFRQIHPLRIQSTQENFFCHFVFDGAQFRQRISDYSYDMSQIC